MKLVNPDLNINIELAENTVQIISIENKALFSKALQNLWNQYNGQEGSFILSEKGKILKIGKEAEVIFNPFDLDINNRKILTKLYKEIAGVTSEEYIEEATIINSRILDFITKIIDQLPYNLELDADMEVSEVLKIYNVRFEEDAITMVERIRDYIFTVHKVCGTSLFIFINLKDYITAEELLLLYKDIFLEKVSLIIIEGRQNRKYEEERTLIIDEDLCTISL